MVYIGAVILWQKELHGNNLNSMGPEAGVICNVNGPTGSE